MMCPDCKGSRRVPDHRNGGERSCRCAPGVIDPMQEATSSREKLTAQIVHDLAGLTDDALAIAATFVRKLPRRALDGETLAEMQRAREAGMRAPEVLPAFSSRGLVLAEVSEERDRQIAKWGDGIPRGGFAPPLSLDDLLSRERAQVACAAAASAGRCTMRAVLEEEVAEVFAERPGSARQREELKQVAAVAVKWIEAIDAQPVPAASVQREREPCPESELWPRGS